MEREAELRCCIVVEGVYSVSFVFLLSLPFPGTLPGGLAPSARGVMGTNHGWTDRLAGHGWVTFSPPPFVASPWYPCSERGK